MPQRFLRPGIRTSAHWNKTSFLAQSLYIGLLTLVDDFGRYDGRARLIHGEVFALRDDVKPQQTAAALSELQNNELVLLYVVDGKEYVQLLRWQERSRSESSKFPDPQDSAAERSVPLEKDASLAIDPRHRSSILDHKPSPSEDASASRAHFERPSIEVMRLHGSKIGLPDSESESCFHFYESKGWKVGREPMKNWQSAMQNWKKGFEERRYERNPTNSRSGSQPIKPVAGSAPNNGF